MVKGIEATATTTIGKGDAASTMCGMETMEAVETKATAVAAKSGATATAKTPITTAVATQRRANRETAAKHRRLG